VAILALTVGAATATRGPGIALLVPLLLYIWKWSPTVRRFSVAVTWAVPLACWGLISYMLYLALAFGDPFLFITGQEHWQILPRISWSEKPCYLA